MTVPAAEKPLPQPMSPAVLAAFLRRWADDAELASAPELSFACARRQSGSTL